MGAELPFWCIDRTPRDLRVPYKMAPKTKSHPSGALGVMAVTVSVADAFTARALKSTRDAIQGVQGRETQDQYRWEWPLRVPDEESIVSQAGVENPLQWRNVCLTWSDKEEVVKEKCLVKLSLLTKSTTGIVSGHLGDGLPYFEIELVSST